MVLCRLRAALFALLILPAAAQAGEDKLEKLSLAPTQTDGALHLVGSSARQQLVVTGHFGDGALRDLTGAARFLSDNPDVFRMDGSIVRLVGPGVARLTVRVGKVETQAAVHCRETTTPQPFSFKNDVMAVLSRAGCNMGTCHGNFNGKNGFRLSLRGENPGFDLDSLARDMHGRRLNLFEPDKSLILLKASGQVNHEGNVRFTPESTEYALLRKWIADGARPDPPATLSVAQLAVTPRERFLWHGADQQQIAVRARFSDGLWRDVTHLAVYEPSSDLVSVSPSGLVKANRAGEATVLVRYLDQRFPVRLAFVPDRPDFRWPDARPHNFIDKHVFDRLQALRVEPSDLADDATFLRRVYLDVCGVLPTVEEARRFLNDKAPDKREKLIDHLLSRPEYADFWAMKWGDLLRNEEKAVDAKGVRLFQQWLRHQFENDAPLDRFARDLLTSRGSTYEKPQANYYRTNLEATKAAETTAVLFLGVRVACAKCHNHPFDRWTQEDYYGLSAFFARIKTRMVDNKRKDKLDKHELVGEMIIYLDREGEVDHPHKAGAMAPRLPGGVTPKLAAGDDRLPVLADWITSRDNPFFARVMANRVWFHLMGRGLVDPPDDFRESNPASNEPLLDALAQELIKHDFSQKKLMRTILLSRAYQASYKPRPSNEEDLNFSRVIPSRLPAELLLDAVSHVTEVPETFAGHPVGIRAVQLPGVTGTSGFLKAFGRPERLLACECERSGDSTLQQAMIMINNESLMRKVEESPRIRRWLDKKAGPDDIAEELFLAACSRPPSNGERALVRKHLAGATEPRRAMEDLLWAVINSKEFLLKR